MKKIEELRWVLDRPKDELKNAQRHMLRGNYAQWHIKLEEDRLKEKTAFSHSLGLKCDAVGWTKLDLSRPDAGEILDKIEKFCKDENWFARGWYTVSYEDTDAEWYVLERMNYVNAYGKKIYVPDEKGDLTEIPTAVTYKLNGTILRAGDNQWVNEKFRDVCLKNSVPGVQFLWVRDVGKYSAKQYFILYPDNNVFHAAYVKLSQNKALEEKQCIDPALPSQLKSFGGHLPRIAEIFTSINFIFPPQFKASDMPKEGFAFVSNSSTPDKARPALTLVHRDTAKILIEEKVINKSNLCAALLYDEIPAQYEEEIHQLSRRPHKTVFEQMEQEYEELLKNPRPQRKVTEKDASRLLRMAKTQRKTDFAIRMKKDMCDILKGTMFELLMPYYLIAEGGILSDEYEFLSYKLALEATKEFVNDMGAEDLLEKKPEAVVFAVCPDGDKVLLKSDGTVSRYSHEEPLEIDKWNDLPQFFAECIEVE